MDDTNLSAELDALLQEEATAVPREKAVELLKQKNHWKEKAIDPETGKHYKTLYEESVAAAKPKPEEQSVPQNVATKDDLAEIRLQSKGYSEEQIRSIKAYAKGQGKDPMEVLEDPFVQSALSAQKAREEVQSAVPAPTGRTISIEGKSLTEMTPAERKANWSKIVEATRK